MYYYYYCINQKFAITYPSFISITSANIFFFFSGDLYKLKAFYQILYQIILCSVYVNIVSKILFKPKQKKYDFILLH